jgi:antitoxin component YwqK of YwqJK toxin-antitoxin module
MSPPADKAGEPGAPGEVTPALDHYPNGNPRFRGFHLDGEMHGEWTFYRADGSVMRTGAFDRGRQVGSWTTFDRAGTAVKVTDFGG